MYPLPFERVNFLTQGIKWSWACRILSRLDYVVDTSNAAKPKPGDLVLVRVEEIGYHTSIVNIENRKLRIYPDDLIVGVFGNRYATDALEGEVSGVEDLSILTSAGMIGTVRSRHEDFGKPTRISFVGFLNQEIGQRINLKTVKPHLTISAPKARNLILAVGTGMNSGKTTAASKLIQQLHSKGFRVGACKLTGSISNRDQEEMKSASAHSTIDFSDYGFPSTYLCTKEELSNLFNTMLHDLGKANPEVVVMEIADGVLQRETSILLSDPAVRELVSGIVLAADSAPAALYAVQRLRELGYPVLAVSGKLTSSPLSVREFQQNCDVEVGSSTHSGEQLADIVCKFITPAVSGEAQ